MTTFVGRETELNNLHQQLHQADRLAITAIQGMGGIGKTELALQYARYHRDVNTYPGGICWLPARDNAANEIVKFAKKLGIAIPEGELDEQVAHIWLHWPSSSKVLIIYDDVTDFERILIYLPPQTEQFRVLFTTRQHFSGLATLEIKELSEGAALRLMRSIVGANRINTQLTETIALCKRLGCLPLALELVGRYLELDADLTIAEVQSELDEMRTDAYALIKDDSAASMTAQLGVAEAFELSLRQLDDDSRDLAVLLSLFAAAPIIWDWVQELLRDISSSTLRQQRNKLLQNSLLQRVRSQIYQLHPLIQEFLRARFADESSSESIQKKYCKYITQLAQTIPQTPTREQILQVTPAVPHLAEAATTWQQWIEDDSLIWPFVGLGRFYEGQGAYGQAEPWWAACLTVTRDRLGNEHPQVATSLNNLAGLYESQGRYAEAEPLYQQALALMQELLGEAHPDVASSLNNLAGLYQSQGRYAEAEPLYQQALALRQELLGEAHPDVATSLNNLAALYDSQGRYAEAEPLYQQALALRQELLGEAHPQVASSLNNLAGLYRSQGRYAEAEPLYQQALALRQELLGEAHPQVASSLNNLAGLYRSQGRYAEAEPFYLKALLICYERLGPEHPNTNTVFQNFAYFVQQVVEAGQGDTLSDHPWTQNLIQQTRNA